MESFSTTARWSAVMLGMSMFAAAKLGDATPGLAGAGAGAGGASGVDFAFALALALALRAAFAPVLPLDLADLEAFALAALAGEVLALIGYSSRGENACALSPNSIIA